MVEKSHLNGTSTSTANDGNVVLESFTNSAALSTWPGLTFSVLFLLMASTYDIPRHHPLSPI